jgi:hypothetical protein
VKHAEYEVGEDVSETMKSTWTAVLVDKTWYLMDVHWSSKKVSGVKSKEWMLLDDNGKVVDKPDVEAQPVEEHYKYDESYFLTNPEELIYSHFPEDDRWQLLSRKVSVDEFQKMAYLKMPFFEFGLRLSSHKKCMIDAPDGLACIQLAMEKNARNHFMYRLWISNKNSKQSRSDLYRNVQLTRFVFMENRHGLMQCTLKFPAAGKFKLELYCSNGSSNFYQCVCAYVLTAKKAADDNKPYPENNRQEWGPGIDMETVDYGRLHTKKVLSWRTKVKPN